MAALKMAMENALNDYNLLPAVVPMQLVLFREAVEHSESFLFPRPSPVSHLWRFKENMKSLNGLSLVPSQGQEATSYLGPGALLARDGHSFL